MTTKNIIAAGVLILNEENKILTFFRGHPFEDVSFPKGKQKTGETLENTAIRETLEETGFTVELIKKLGVTKYAYYWGPTKESVTKEVHYFLGKIVEGKLNVENGGKDNIQKAEWLKPSELIALVKHDAEKRMVESLIEVLQHEKTPLSRDFLLTQEL